jgi:beta-hydroxylase
MIRIVIISVFGCGITHILFAQWIFARQYDLLAIFVPFLLVAFLGWLALVIVCAQLIYLVKLKTRGIAGMQVSLDQLSAKSGPGELERLQRWIDLEAGRLPANPGVLMRPPCFPGLTSKPWHRPGEFAWTKTLEDSFGIIKKEALSIYADHEKKTDGQQLKQYNYVGVSKKTWLSFYIYQGGFVKENCKRCPGTEAILRSLPISFPNEIIFSILDPHSKISPHRDTGNLTLTCHLGLSVPPSCAIKVGGEERAWQEGKCLILDASYEHEAWNDSDQPRIILLFDFFHPELTPLEREYVNTMRGIPTHA